MVQEIQHNLRNIQKNRKIKQGVKSSTSFTKTFSIVHIDFNILQYIKELIYQYGCILKIKQKNNTKNSITNMKN